MASIGESHSGNSESISKKPFMTTVVILGLSLGTWLFFYLSSMELTPAGTSVVVAFWLLVVLFSRWIWKRPRRKEQNRVIR